MLHLPTRVGRRVAFWAVAGVALLAGHDLIHLVQVGPGRELTRALRTAGHGYWGAASVALALVALVVAVAVGLRLRRLHRRAARLGVGRADVRRARYPARSLATWSRLFVTVALLFVLQESVEHFIAHGHVIGLGALVGPESPLALPVFAAITAIGALLLAAVAQAETELVRAIVAALRRRPHAPRRLPRPVLRTPPRRPSVLAGRVAGRAPPRMPALP